MPGCRTFPPSVLALAPLESPPPGLVAVPLFPAWLDLPGRSVSVSPRVQAPPVGTRPQQSSLAAAEARRVSALPRPPVDDRRRWRVLCWGARCEAALAP